MTWLGSASSSQNPSEKKHHLLTLFQLLIHCYLLVVLCQISSCSSCCWQWQRGDWLCVQNYFRDPWNVFDFITVVGSVTDVVLTEIIAGVHEVSSFVWHAPLLYTLYTSSFLAQCICIHAYVTSGWGRVTDMHCRLDRLGTSPRQSRE